MEVGIEGGMEGLWRPDRSEVRVDGKRLVAVEVGGDAADAGSPKV